MMTAAVYLGIRTMGRLLFYKIDRAVEKGIAPHPTGNAGLNMYYVDRWNKRQNEIQTEKKDVRESYAVSGSGSEKMDTTAPEQQADRKSLFGNLRKRGTLFGN